MALSVCDSLPPELLVQIFSYLAEPAPSDSRLHDQPKPDMLRSSEHNNLKSVSLVSKRWRSIILPFLFRHSVWSFDRWDLLYVEPDPDDVSRDPRDLPFLRFLLDNNLGRYVDSITLIVSDSLQNRPPPPRQRDEFGFEVYGDDSDSDRDGDGEPSSSSSDARKTMLMDRAATYNEDNNWFWEVLFEIMDPRRFTLVASPQMLASLLSRMLFLGDSWSFSSLCHILSLSREHRRPVAMGADVVADSATGPATGVVPDPVPCSSCGRSRKRVPSKLFSIRPWTSLLLNEGSSIRVYQTYEFFLKRPPSILGALLGCEEAPNDMPLFPSTVKTMAYVGIFPLSSHFNILINHLPRLDKLFVQLVPRSDLMNDSQEMRNVLTSDLWMQRNTCYSLVMRKLLVGALEDDDAGLPDTGPWDGEPSDAEDEDSHGENNARSLTNNWQYLKEFESGDAADREAWEMAAQYVEMSRSGWRVAGDGIFVKGPRPPPADGDDEAHLQFHLWADYVEGNEMEVDGEQSDSQDDTGPGENGIEHTETHSAEGDNDHVEIFQRNLERVAFRGTAKLPFSPATHYVTGGMDFLTDSDGLGPDFVNDHAHWDVFGPTVWDDGFL